jgi:hypothetical protein
VESSTDGDDDLLIRVGEFLVEGFIKADDGVRQRILPLARGLCAAKRKYPATQAFGAWLQGSPYLKIGKDTRAALIKIGEHEEIAGEFLLATAWDSPRAIWAAIERSLPSSAISHPAKSRNSPSAPELPTPPAYAPAAEASTRMTCRTGFSKAPRAQELYEIFQNKEARSTLGRVWRGKHGREIWDLIVTALDAGLLVRNNRAFTTPSLWLLFPSTSAVKVYGDFQDLQEPGANLSYIKNVLLPIMISHRDDLMANPDRAEETLTECMENRRRSFFVIKTKDTDARAETPLLSQHIPTPDTPPNVDDINTCVDLLVEEIESRIEKLAHLCGPLDIEFKQGVVARLNESLIKIVLPAPDLTSSNDET